MPNAWTWRGPARERRAARGSRRGPGAALLACLLVCFAPLLRAAEVIPPRPQKYFSDYASLVNPSTATRLNRELEQFERDTSNQVVVAIYPRLQSDSSVEDYTVRLAEAWGFGQKGRSNGAVLFVFQQSHDLRIVTGYGLEGALPDALCKRIIEDEIVPRFRAGNFDAGLVAGVHAMLAAARGEYRGSGRTQTEARTRAGGGNGLFFVVVTVIIIFAVLRGRSRRGMVYGRGGRRAIWTDPWIGGGGGGWGGGSWGGGSSGGGSITPGGGSFGGGGAGGKW